MRHEVKLTSQAIVQIEESVQYISKVLFTPETARKWADALQSEIAELDFMPSRYHITKDAATAQGSRTLRQTSCPRFRI